VFTLASIANAVLERVCVKKQDIKRCLPCGKPVREKAFELHTVSEIILDVVLNMIWHLIEAAFSIASAGRILLHEQA